MSSVNKVILIGHLGRDPETRRTANGDPVVSFSIATSESWRDKAIGERKDRTEWHNVVIFNEGLAKIAEQYLKKGSRLYVEGKMRPREYKDRDGNPRKVTEVVLERFSGELVLLDRTERQAPDPDSYGKTTTRSTTPQNSADLDDPRLGMDTKPARTSDIIDDDIPF